MQWIYRAASRLLTRCLHFVICAHRCQGVRAWKANVVGFLLELAKVVVLCKLEHFHVIAIQSAPTSPS